MTHIVLGACIGEAIAGKYMDKRAMFYGALAQSVPDVDFVTAFFLHGAENVVAHRGITHSILFGVAATFFLTWLVKKVIHKTPLPLKNVLLLFAVNIFVHLLLDTFNAYGVSLLMPFNAHRFTLNLLYVADPLFSIAPFVSFLFLLLLNKSHRQRVRWIQTGITVSAIYVCIAIANKYVVNRAVQADLIHQGKKEEFFSTPAPFTTLLWFVAAKDSAGYSTTYRSVFDNGPLPFTYHPRSESAADTITNQKDIRLLKDFSQGYYSYEQWGDTTVINVLRFGQVAGWYNPHGRFAFHYYLSHPGNNDMVVQRGRFMQWNKQSREAFFKRMFGRP